MANKNAIQPEPITKQLNSSLVCAALKVAEWPSVDLHDAESVRTRIRDYFELCDTQGLRPSNLGLYASLGLTRQDVSDILRNRNRSRVSTATIDMIQKAKASLSLYREQLCLMGKVSPPIGIFWAKNFDQMVDVAQLEVTRQDGQRANMTPDQVLRRIEQDIPIDIDPAYQEGDTNGKY